MRRRVVAALRAKGVPCRALVRDRARAANLLPEPSAAGPAVGGSSGSVPEFDIVTGDVYQYATLPTALKGCNAGLVSHAAAGGVSLQTPALVAPARLIC